MNALTSLLAGARAGIALVLATSFIGGAYASDTDPDYLKYRCGVLKDDDACKQLPPAPAPVPHQAPGPYASWLIYNGFQTKEAIARARFEVGEEPDWVVPCVVARPRLSAYEIYERWSEDWSGPLVLEDEREERKRCDKAASGTRR